MSPQVSFPLWRRISCGFHASASNSERGYEGNLFPSSLRLEEIEERVCVFTVSCGVQGFRLLNRGKSVFTLFFFFNIYLRYLNRAESNIHFSACTHLKKINTKINSQLLFNAWRRINKLKNYKKNQGSKPS